MRWDLETFGETSSIIQVFTRVSERRKLNETIWMWSNII